jgi:type II secretory ATPase GspE/PulE/Tfp pilus assembly ATPase PilB-like protein
MQNSLEDLVSRGRESRLPVALLESMEFDGSVLKAVEPQVARKHRVVPIGETQGRIFLACVDKATQLEDYFSRLLEREIIPVLVSSESMDWALGQYYGETAQELTEIARESVNRYARQAPEKNEEAQTPVAKLVKHALLQALRMRASDIHLEPFQGQNRMRYRVDGVLIDQGEISGRLYDAVASRIKILAKLDIAEKRRPQDGRATFNLDGQEIDARVSVMPSLDGEGVVVRLLGGNKSPSNLDELGFPLSLKERWLRLARGAHGIVLVTGPTGSGKTTTLYGTLKAIQSPDRKILTLEEPVEARLEGVLQIPIRSDIGFTFQSGLRAALRHDPDIMLVGEIRDRESAEIAIAASLTGHLLFATLHTNTAAQAVTRLLDMGLKEYQVMTALRGVLAQRLLRRLCDECKNPIPASESGIDWSGHGETPPQVTYRPAGCETCSGIGFRGRIPIFELLEITSEMRRLRGSELDDHYISELRTDQEYSSLAQSARRAVRAGLTSVGEYYSLLGEDERHACGERTLTGI